MVVAEGSERLSVELHHAGTALEHGTNSRQRDTFERARDTRVRRAR